MGVYIKRSNYWEYFLKNHDAKELFFSVEDKERQKELFCKYVNVVNIELSAYCNRKCHYCPMALYHRKQAYMADEIWQKILTELVDIDYKGHICLNLYNEPLLDMHLVERIKEIREKLPEVFIKFDSNGDYLTREKLDELIDAGLNSMIITRHVEINQMFDEQYEKIKEYVSALGLESYIVAQKHESNTNVTYLVRYRDMELFFCANNWSILGNDRGGTVKGLKSADVRTMPCNNPIREVQISYDGLFKPCCNIYFGENTTVGSIKKDGILKTYFSQPCIQYRRDLVTFGKKSGKCATCNTEDNSDMESAEIRESLIKD